MSFLTAQEAVQMCILSKRWKNLWTTLPFLNFDLHKFRNNWCAREDDEHEIECRLFRNFVNMTLLRKATDLLKFRLSCLEMHCEFYDLFIRSWIRYALDKNPRVLDINIGIENSLPVGVFTCASLVDLSLSRCLGSNQFPVVNLPRIKRLHLLSLHLNQDSMKNLLYGCPVLEFLQLEGCNLEFSSIQSQSLKHLKIQGWCAFWEPHLMTGIILEFIDAPNLLSFSYRRCAQYIGHKLLLNMPSLTNAILCMERCTSHHQFSGNRKVFTGISSVKTVKLSGLWIKEFLKAELPRCPIFPNMKDLSLDDLCLSCDFNTLASFASLSSDLWYIP